MQLTQLELFKENDLPPFSGKTSQECLTPKIMPSDASWDSLLGQMLPYSPKQEDGRVQVMLSDLSARSRGECSTLNISECPNDAVESSSSQILQPTEQIHPRFYLSAKACEGILRRAKGRNVTLPKMLTDALIAGIARGQE